MNILDNKTVRTMTEKELAQHQVDVANAAKIENAPSTEERIKALETQVFAKVVK